MSPLLAGLSCLAMLALPASAEHHEKSAEHHQKAGGGAPPIEVISANVQGKNVFIPSTIVVAENEPHTLTIFNTTDTPHGFTIHELGVEVILAPGEETLVQIPAVSDGKIYRVNCHLHPPHRSAQLVVLDTD